MALRGDAAANTDSSGPSLLRRTLIATARSLTGIKFDRPALPPTAELDLGLGKAASRHHSTAEGAGRRDTAAASAINPGHARRAPPAEGASTSTATTTAHAAAPSPVRLAKNIPYVEGPGFVNARGYNKQSLDVFCPPLDHPDAEKGRLLPVVVHFHGGSWRRGDRSIPFYGSPGFGQGLASRGCIVVTPSYRLGDHAHIKQDAVAAVEWAANNIERYGGDPHRIIVSGHSAGGNISASLATNPSWLPGGVRSGNVAGFVAISGVYNMMQPFATGLEAGWSLGAKNALFRHVNLFAERTRWLGADVGTVLNFSPGARVEQTLRRHEHEHAHARELELEAAARRAPRAARGPQGQQGHGWWDSIASALGGGGGGGGGPAAPAAPTGFDAGEIAAADPATLDPLFAVEELRSKPLLLLNGGSDLGLEHDGQRFANNLGALGVPIAYHTLQGADHASVMWDTRTFDLVAQYARTAVPPPTAAPAAEPPSAAHA